MSRRRINLPPPPKVSFNVVMFSQFCRLLKLVETIHHFSQGQGCWNIVLKTGRVNDLTARLELMENRLSRRVTTLMILTQLIHLKLKGRRKSVEERGFTFGGKREK